MCFTRNFDEMLQESRLSSESQVRSHSDDNELLDAQLEDFQDKVESAVVGFTVDGYIV